MLPVNTQSEIKDPVELSGLNREISGKRLKSLSLLVAIAFLTLFPVFVSYAWSPFTYLGWWGGGSMYVFFVGSGLLLIWKFYLQSIFQSIQMMTSLVGSAELPLESIAIALRDRIVALESALQQVNLIVRELPQGVLVFSHEGSLLEINKAGAQMIDIFSLRGPELISVAAERLNDCGIEVVLERALNHGECSESDIQVGSSKPRWLQAQSQPFIGLDGKDGALVILTEVTRLRQLEHVRRDFVANVSHELRTPVTSITGFVETLLDNMMLPDTEAEHFLQIIHKHSVRLGAIIDDLLSLADIELDEHRTIAFTDSAMASVISSAIEPLSQAAASRSVTIRVMCESDLICRMNSHLVEQALANLIDNAIKFSNRGSEIKISAQRSLKQIKVSVTDDGVGISSEHQERIFERFYRVDRSRNRDQGGTGLGLSIVKHIVQAHGGEVSVHSSGNSGSTFTLSLPG